MQPSLFDYDDAGDPQCQHPEVAASTGYRYGCRCPRCRAGKVQTPSPTCEVDGCTDPRTKRRRRCPLHDAMCRRPGCTNPRRPVSAAQYCEEHTTSLRYDPARCDHCGHEYERRRSGSHPADRLALCPSCRKRWDKTTRQWRRHGVPYAMMLAWLRDPRCWICQQPINPRVGWGDETGHVDHDHRCHPGDLGCPQCVRGLAHARCNLLLGHVEALRDRVGLEHMRRVVDAVTSERETPVF